MNPILLNVIHGLGQKIIPFLVGKIVEVELDDTNPPGEAKKEWTVSNVKDYLLTAGKKITSDEKDNIEYAIDLLVDALNKSGALKPHSQKEDKDRNCNCKNE